MFYKAKIIFPEKHSLVRYKCIFFASLIFVIFTANLEAQSLRQARNRVFFEAFGPGIVYSMNYERILNNRFAVRFGISGWPQSGYQYVLGFGMASIRVGSPVHSLHLGIGTGLAWFSDVDLLEQSNVVGMYGTASLSYQFQPRSRGFFLRISYTPFFSLEAVAPLWGGISLGWIF